MRSCTKAQNAEKEGSYPSENFEPSHPRRVSAIVWSAASAGRHFRANFHESPGQENDP